MKNKKIHYIYTAPKFPKKNISKGANKKLKNQKNTRKGVVI